MPVPDYLYFHSFVISLEAWKCDSPNFSSFFKIILDIIDILNFYMIFRISIYISQKKADISIWLALNALSV